MTLIGVTWATLLAPGNPPAKQDTQVQSLGGKDPLEKEPTPIFLPGKSHGQRSLGATVHGVVMSQTRLSD